MANETEHEESAAGGDAVAAGVEMESAGGGRAAREQDPAGHPLSVPMN
jgi:hypothetical protein